MGMRFGGLAAAVAAVLFAGVSVVQAVPIPMDNNPLLIPGNNSFTPAFGTGSLWLSGDLVQTNANSMSMIVFRNTGWDVPRAVGTYGYGFAGFDLIRSGGSSIGKIGTGSETAMSVLLRIDFDASGTTDNIHVWGGASSFATQPADSAASVTDTSGDIGTMMWLTVDLSNGGTATNIKLGTEFADVAGVPEPTSMALLGLGGLALLRRKSRAC